MVQWPRRFKLEAVPRGSLLTGLSPQLSPAAASSASVALAEGDQRPLGTRSEAVRSSTGQAKTVKSLPYFLQKTPQIRESG